MTPVLDPKKVAETNPAVDAQKIEQLQEIRQVLEKAGVVKKADYRLSPPLGTGPARTAPSGTFVVRMHRG
jgi:hypothetical protein